MEEERINKISQDITEEEYRKDLLIEKILNKLENKKISLNTFKFKEIIKDGKMRGLIAINIKKSGIVLNEDIREICKKNNYNINNNYIYMENINVPPKEYIELNSEILKHITTRINKYIETQIKDFNDTDQEKIIDAIRLLLHDYI